MRVWVRDNRDIPGVEQTIERLAAAHFQDDLGRSLTPEETTRLDDRLAYFIADGKSGDAGAGGGRTRGGGSI